MPVTLLGNPTGRRARLARWCALIAASFAAVTCDLFTDPGAGGAGGIQVAYLGDTVLVVGQPIPLNVTVTDGGAPLQGAQLRLTSSDSAVIRVVDLGTGTDTILPLKRGAARVRATLVGSTLGDNPPFAEVNITSIAAAVSIDSLSVTFVSIGDTVTLRASVFDFNGNKIDSSAAWTSVSPTVVDVDAVTGRVRARASTTTPVTIRAVVDNDTATVPVTVRQQLARYQFSAPILTITSLNLDTVVSIVPQDANGSAIPLNTAGLPAPTFTSRNTAVVSVTPQASTAGAYRLRVSSITNDTTRIRVQGGSLDTTMAVTVGQVAQTIQIQGPDTVAIDALQDTLALRARAFDDRSVEVQTRQVIWTSLNTGVLTVTANGVTTAVVRAGTTLATALLTARLDGALDTVAVVVRNVPRNIRTPATRSFSAIGDTSTVIDSVFNQLGGLVPNAPVVWSSLNAPAAAVDPASGLVTAMGVGSANIVATIVGCVGPGCADTTAVSVINEAVSVNITPTALTLNSIGDAIQLPVTITNSRGATNLPASSVTWSVDDPNVISVSSTGVVTALRRGILTGTPNVLAPAHVVARVPSGNSADTVAVIVTNAPVSLTLAPDPFTLTAPTRTLQYTATARNLAGAIIPAADLAAAGQPVTFRSTRPVAATVDAATGVATQVAQTPDNALIIAEVVGDVGLRADTALLSLTNTAVQVVLNRDTVAIGAVGDQAQLIARAINVQGDTVPGLTFTWTALNPAVAQVNGSGLVTAMGLGPARVTASFGTLPPDTTVVVVTNAPTSIAIVLGAVTLGSIGDDTLPQATLLNRLGAVLPRDAATWISVNPGIASVSPLGRITALNRGVTQVIARSPLDALVADTILVNVTNAAATINVLRGNDTLPSLNRTLLYTADVFNARGCQIVGEPVRWLSSNPGVATVGVGSGVATSIDTGSAFIIALDTSLAGLVRDTAVLVVRNRAVAVDLSPASLAMPTVGSLQLVSASARNEQGNPIVNVPVTWTTSAPAVVRFRPTAATFSSGPIGTIDTVRIEAVGTGSATITATVGGVANTMGVTVSNAPTTVLITSGNLTLNSVGDQVTPAATISNASGALPRNAVLWTSSNANVATVSSDGVVTATGPGAATITATSPANGALSSSITVTVTNAPASVTVAPAGPLTLTALQRTVQLSPIVRNAANGIIANPSVTWSGGGAVASVNATGLVTATAVGGPVNITATSGSASANVAVTVTNNAVSLALTPDSVTILDLTGAGSTTQLVAIALNDLGNPVSAGAITWTPVNAAVANVNATGLVSAVSVGTALVRASVSGLTDSTLVTVANAPRTLNIVPANRTLASVADTAFPQTTILNAAGAALPRTAVVWGSSAPNIATVSTDGIVTALSAGTTTITATSPYQPSLTDSYAVTVTNAPATVTLNQANVTLTALSRTTTFTAVVRNARGDAIPSASVTWTSGNAAVDIGLNTGIATAIAVNAGVTITGTVVGAPTVTANANVVVTNNAATINVTPSAIAFTSVTGTQALTISVLNDLGNVIVGAPVSVVSNSLAVATITGTTVNAAGVGGTTVTVTSGAVNASVSVTVTDGTLPATITLDHAALTITALGADSVVTPTVRNSVGTILGGALLTWIQSPAGVLTLPGGAVAGAQTVSGLAVGTTTVTVTTSNGLTAQFTATVRNDVANVNITTAGGQATPAFLPTGDSLLAAVTLQNSEGAAITDRRAVTWTSTNSAVAAVADSGMIFGVGSGSAIIRAVSSNNTGARDSIFVLVAALDHFEVEASGGGPIGTQAADTPFNIRITGHDASHQTVTSFSGTVVLTSNSTLVGAPVTTANFTNGVLTQSLQVTSSGFFRTITATLSGGSKSGTSNTFNVDAGAVVAFQVFAPGLNPIPTQQVGVAFDVVLRAVDAFGNVPNFTGTVEVSAINGATITGQPITSAAFSGGQLVHSITLAAGSDGAGRAIQVVRTGGTETGTSNTFTVTP